MLPRLRAPVLGALTALALLAVVPATLRAQYAVIVHPGSKVSNLSREQLRRVLLAETLTLGGRDVQLVEHVPSRHAFYRVAVAMNEAGVRRTWIAAGFRGEVHTGVPIELAEAGEVRRYVAEHPGAVGFVPAAAANETVKVLTIDGARPGDANYALR